MIRAVFDTSVLTAAFLKRGGPNHRILQQGGKKYQLYLSEAILAETRRVLLTYRRIRKSYPYSDQDVDNFIASLRKASEETISLWPEVKVIEEDPADDMVLGCGLAVKADYVVSKDDHLKDLEEYQGIKIVSTDEFLEMIDQP